MKYVEKYFTELMELLFEMAPWLLFGFLIAGLLHVFFPDGKINNLLGKANMKSVIRAALIGIPLPLCSCGVIPTGISIHKNGASKGAAVSFLISTPQTGVDSILVTYSLLGFPFAVIRPVVALITGIFGGYLTSKTDKADNTVNNKSKPGSLLQSRVRNPLKEIFRYAYIDFLADIAKWLIIGLLIAALIAVLVPDDFFASYIHNDFIGMLIILGASIPVYVCATSSVPIAAVLLMKGISPGAALVFLMAGPATNAATISVIGNSLGRKSLITYMATLTGGALLSGLFIDYFLPSDWFTIISQEHNHEHGLLPQWLQVSSGIIMVLMLLNIYIRKLMKKNKTIGSDNQLEMSGIKVFIRGMNCNHCKMNVESNLLKLEGIDKIHINLDKEEAILTGNNINLDEVKSTVKGLGYKFEQ